MVNKDAAIRRRVMFGAASNYVGQFINLGTLFFLTPFILHRLGPTSYGLWVLLSSLVAYGSLLDFGLWGAIIKYVAEYRARQQTEQARALVSTAMGIYLVLGVLVLLIGLVAAIAAPRLLNLPADQASQATTLICLMSLGLGASLPGMLPLSILRGLQRYDAVNAVEIAATLVTAAATIILLWAGIGVLGVVVANLIGVFVLIGLGTWALRRLAPELRLTRRNFDPQLVRTVLSFSWPLFVRDAAGRLQTRTDEITIGIFLPLAAIAPYNVARRLSEMTQLLTKQFMKVLLPLASELHAENDHARLRQVLLAGTRITLALSGAIGVALIVLSEPLLRLWVGPQYASAAPLVALLTTASLFAACQWPAGAVLQGMARHRVLAATALICGAANLSLSVALVGPLGLTGVALGTLIPSVVEFVVVLPIAMRLVGLPWGTMLGKVLLPGLSPALLMGLVLAWLGRDLGQSSWAATILVAAAGLGVFAVAYLALGASQAERDTYRGLAFSAFRLATGWLRR
jgi:O-antigen/teichoic acid export membrane protein